MPKSLAHTSRTLWHRNGVAALTLWLVAACSGSVDDPGAGDAGTVDLERGELLALACRACHTLGAGEDHLLGPNLHGVFGRSTASAPGFEYSVALREADFVWTPDALDAWLAEPSGFLPGNNMTFAGFNSPSDRRDLLAYLLRVTAEGAP